MKIFLKYVKKKFKNNFRYKNQSKRWVKFNQKNQIIEVVY